MKRIILAAAALLMTGSAYAADLGGSLKDTYSEAAPQCAGVSWTGLRIGGLVGVGATGIGSGEGTASGVKDGDRWTDQLTTTGAYQLSTIGQLEIGGDWQFKGTPLVIGAFGNIGFGSGTTDLTYSLNGRVGVAVGTALIYGFGGWEKAHAARELTDFYGAPITTMKSDPDGFVYGAGVDVALGRNWYVGVRAERVDYGTLTAKGSADGVDYVVKTSATDNRGLLTLGYKF